MKWHPIHTAPKDGSYILVYLPEVFMSNPSLISIVRWDDGYWVEFEDKECWHKYLPTHWMQLPELPEVLERLDEMES